jgi:hypothetical protein
MTVFCIAFHQGMHIKLKRRSMRTKFAFSSLSDASLGSASSGSSALPFFATGASASSSDASRARLPFDFGLLLGLATAWVLGAGVAALAAFTRALERVALGASEGAASALAAVFFLGGILGQDLLLWWAGVGVAYLYRREPRAGGRAKGGESA